MAYSTQAQIEAILGRSLTAGEITLLAGVQLSADSWIDNQIGVNFGTGSSSRYYDGGNKLLALDVVRDITAVELVDINLNSVYTYVVDQDYIQLPLNDTVKRHLEKRSFVEGVFYDDIDGSDIWPKGSKRIKVTGTFSYADSPPADIEYLSAYLSAKYFTANAFSGSGASGEIVKESIEGYSREYANNSNVTSDFAGLIDGVVTSIVSNYTDDEIFF